MHSDTIFVQSSEICGFVTEPPTGGTVLVRRNLVSRDGVRVPVDELDSQSLRLVLDMIKSDDESA